MSEVRVNKISPRSGTTVTLGDSGDTITIPSGVTFDASSGGLAGTLTTAAQPNITSVGTLTSFASTGIDDNATSTAITIDSSQNVGIGTASPFYNLDILGQTGSLARLRIKNDGTLGSDSSVLQLQIGGTTAESLIYFANPSDANVGQIRYDHASDYMSINVNASERMRIDSSGNVGIGTSSPSQKLDVVGSIEVSDGVYLGGTGTANKLDDYEEGTFTPSFSNTNGFSNLSYTDQQGYYTKIGQLVNVRIRIRLGSGVTKNSNRIIMDGLPFTSANTTGTGNGLYWQYVDDQIIGSNTTNIPILWIANNSNAVNLYKTDGNSFTGNDTSGSTTNMDFYFTGSYTTS